jgi:DNA-binding response OmpR family regulator
MSPPSPAKRILIVDDEPSIRQLFADVLSLDGYTVDLAATAQEAKARLSAQTYDLVITDWRLPDGDGRLVADWAAELGAKTCLMSGYLSHMSGGMAQGHDTLMKPIHPGVLIAFVRQFIGKPKEAC